MIFLHIFGLIPRQMQVVLGRMVVEPTKNGIEGIYKANRNRFGQIFFLEDMRCHERGTDWPGGTSFTCIFFFLIIPRDFGLLQRV